jgi:hypothetical protein
MNLPWIRVSLTPKLRDVTSEDEAVKPFGIHSFVHGSVVFAEKLTYYWGGFHVIFMVAMP